MITADRNFHSKLCPDHQARLHLESFQGKPSTTPRSLPIGLSIQNYFQFTNFISIQNIFDQNTVHFAKPGFICKFPGNTPSNTPSSFLFALSY